ncbi:hypothetical protein [Oleomonas cavernae]|uniref:hypothetical protein n=1 Tax=Oleomonas cavernae TaxID=2320859 RepID=UPI0011C4170C|nr:hypothetical protein [Oleomonas cavernae]
MTGFPFFLASTRSTGSGRRVNDDPPALVNRKTRIEIFHTHLLKNMRLAAQGTSVMMGRPSKGE